MAKAGKVSTNLQHNILERRNKRRSGQRPRRRYYLIVCEGEATEPNYFDAIRKILPNEMVKRISISGEAKNTLSLVKETERLVTERRKSSCPPYYKIWVVFDKDSFPDDDFDNAIEQIESRSFSDGFHTEEWHAAWSNEAFELWYILHFREQVGGPLSRKTYSDILTQEMGRKYEKNAGDMFDLLRSKLNLAIDRAARALQSQAGKSYHEMNPATTVHILVSELMKYIEP